MDKKWGQVEDLLADETFLSWFYQSDENAIAEWEGRIASDPDLKQLSEAASKLLRTMPLINQPVPEQQVENAHQRLMATVNTSDKKVVSMTFSKRKWWITAVAASILLMVSIGIVSRFNSETHIKTAYGQVKVHILPDGSEVTLNANSTITVRDSWKKGNDREVWLNGEAFFHVKHTENNSRFIVHTNSFDIFVTGTRFNVVNRHKMTNVLLKEGSVTICSGKGTELFMKPGEFVDVVKEKIAKKPVKESQVMAWTQRKIEFENTSMKEVADIIHTHYGIEVKLETNAVAEKKISGIMPNDNLDVLIQTLQALDFVIEKKEHSIVIK